MGSGIAAFSDIRNLALSTSLQSLNLHANEISVISGIDSLVNLTSLNLSSNRIGTIQGLDKLIRLTSLDLSSNQVRSDSASDSCHTSVLRLQIREVSGLQSLHALTTLKLAYNKITSLAGLSKENFQGIAPRLQRLDLRDNRIHPLDELLHLSACRVSSRTLSL